MTRMPSSRETRTGEPRPLARAASRHRRLGAGLLAGLLAVSTAACTSTGDRPGTGAASTGEFAFVNVRKHLSGAKVLNVECPDGVWTPRDAHDEPVVVKDLDGVSRTAFDMDPGTTVAVIDPATNADVELLCVPDVLPEFGDAWIGTWVSMGLYSNADWRTTLPLRAKGATIATRTHEIVVDPYGVIRSYRMVVVIPAAVEQDTVTSGLIYYGHPADSDDSVTDSLATGTPPTGSYIAIQGERPGPDGSTTETLRIESPPGSFRLDGHDFLTLENGNYLAIGYEPIEEPGDGLTLPPTAPESCRNRAAGEPVTMLRTRVIEYGRDGSIVKIWRSEDHLPAAAGPAVRVEISEIDGKRVCIYDIEHANALDVDGRGGVVVGFRNATTSAILVDWASGDVLWTLGGDGPKALKIENDRYDGPLAAHDATVTVENGVTRLSFFDNNTGRGLPRYVRYVVEANQRRAVLETDVTVTCGKSTCYSLATGSAAAIRGEGDDAEVLVNPGVVVGEDITVPMDGELLLYRGEKLVRRVALGPWWLYRATVLPEEPWSRAAKP